MGRVEWSPVSRPVGGKPSPARPLTELADTGHTVHHSASSFGPIRKQNKTKQELHDLVFHEDSHGNVNTRLKPLYHSVGFLDCFTTLFRLHKVWSTVDYKNECKWPLSHEQSLALAIEPRSRRLRSRGRAVLHGVT